MCMLFCRISNSYYKSCVFSKFLLAFSDTTKIEQVCSNAEGIRQRVDPHLFKFAKTNCISKYLLFPVPLSVITLQIKFVLYSPIHLMQMMQCGVQEGFVLHVLWVIKSIITPFRFFSGFDNPNYIESPRNN